AVLRRPLVRTGLVIAAVLAVAALLVFEPWKLVVDEHVDEAAPVAPTAAPVAPAPAAPAEPVVLARGTLVAHEHASSGTVVVLGLPDGSRVLRLQDLRTSNGPKLRVWLSDQFVVEGRD